MRISSAGLDLIKEAESYLKKQADGSCKAYQCPAGVWTCGWGCTEGVGPNTQWTKAEATEALAREMAKHEQAIMKLVKVPLTQGQFDALVSLCYNIGPGNIAKSTLLKYLNEGDVARAASHFADFKKARVKGAVARRMGVKDGELVTLPGLVKRRAAEMALFLSDSEDHDMPQAVAKPDSKLRLGEAVAKVGTGAGIVGGGGVTVAHQTGAVPTIDTHLDKAKQAVAKGQEVRQVVKDARELVPGGIRYNDPAVIGAGVIVVIGIAVAVFLAKRS